MKIREFKTLNEINNYISKESGKKFIIRDEEKYILECTKLLKKNNIKELENALNFIKDSINEHRKLVKDEQIQILFNEKLKQYVIISKINNYNKILITILI